jgi:hypothetical protein
MKIEARPIGGMTGVSRIEGRTGRVRSLNVLARASLVLSAIGASACFDATPTYIVPAQSPPIILGNQVVPSTVTVNVVTLDETQSLTVPLNVPFKSIDSGEPLVAIFWQDLNPNETQEVKNTQLQGVISVREDARPLDEQIGREFTFRWTVTQAGCRIVTMNLSHASNFPTNPEQGIFEPGHLPPTDQTDIAQVSWFFDVRDKSAPTVQPCWSTQ